MYWTNNQRLSFFSILFLLLYFIKEILSLGIRIDITMETKDTIYVIELKFNKSAQEALPCIFFLVGGLQICWDAILWGRLLKNHDVWSTDF